MRYHVAVGDRTYLVELGPEGTSVDGIAVRAHLAHVNGTDVHNLIMDGASYRLVAARSGSDAWDLHLRGRRLTVEVVDERTHTIREMTGAGSGPAGPRPVRAPMPGLVVKIDVAAGDAVEVGQGLVIVEAMKMENELKAEVAGVVARVHVEPGQAVEKDQILVDFASPEDEGDADVPPEKDT